MDRSATPRSMLLSIVREKHNQLEKIMEKQNIDCWLVFLRETASSPDPVQNLVIGGDVVWESAFIFHTKADKLSKIAIVGNFDADAEKEKQLWDVVKDYQHGISDILIETISEINPEKIALNYSLDDVTSDGLSYGMHMKLTHILSAFSDRFVSAEKIIQAVRSQKSKTEIELVTKACELTEEINSTIQGQLTLGMTERQIQELYHAEMSNQGVIEAWQRDSCPAVDAGPDKVFGHVGPSKLKIAAGHTLHNDFGVQLNGYCSDIQRMVFFGKKEDIPDELNHAFETVRDAIEKSSKFIKPGVAGKDVDKVARDHIISKGYSEFEHALGHQVGTKAHDGGVLLGPKWERYGALPDGKVELNNIFTLELYVKTENYGMVSLEEVIVVKEDRGHFLVPRQEEWITR